jgi:hypothetical protein
VQVIADDLRNLGYIFQWSKLNAANFLLLQRRLRVWGFADLDEGQDLDDFSSRMHDTLHSMASEIRFPFEAVFDATIPEAPVEGNAALNVQQALESSAIKNGSSNLFVDTSTSSQWASEFAENISTCIRPTHSIFSTRLNRCITAKEMFLCQGIFAQDFNNPDAIEHVLQNPKDAQSLAGNAFASTVAQVQLLAGLVNAVAWKHVAPSTGSASGVSFQAACSSDSLEFGDVSSSSALVTPCHKRKSTMEKFLVHNDKRRCFEQAPAAPPHQDRVFTILHCTVQ